MNLDLLDEVREQACIKAEALKRRVEQKERYKLRPRQFQVVDLISWRANYLPSGPAHSAWWRLSETKLISLRLWRGDLYPKRGMNPILSFISDDV